MNKMPYDKAPKLPVRWDARLLQNQEEFQLLQIAVGTGDVIETHDNPDDVAFYVLEGKGALVVDGVVYEAIVGDTFFIPTGCQREWQNTGDQFLKLLVFKLLKG